MKKLVIFVVAFILIFSGCSEEKISKGPVPENENSLYFSGNGIYFDSLVKNVSTRSPLSQP